MAERIKVSISLYQEEIDELDKLAEAVGVNRSELIRRMLRKEQLDDKAIGVLEWLTSHNVRYAQAKKEKRQQLADASVASSQAYQDNTKNLQTEIEIINAAKNWPNMDYEEFQRQLNGF